MVRPIGPPGGPVGEAFVEGRQMRRGSRLGRFVPPRLRGSLEATARLAYGLLIVSG